MVGDLARHIQMVGVELQGMGGGRFLLLSAGFLCIGHWHNPVVHNMCKVRMLMQGELVALSTRIYLVVILANF